MSRVSISESPIHGMGVFAVYALGPGEIVLKVDDSRVVTDSDPLDPAKGELEHHCDYLASGAVVLMHGVKGNRLAMLRRARLLHAEGFGVLLFDFQAHGESAGKGTL